MALVSQSYAYMDFVFLCTMRVMYFLFDILIYMEFHYWLGYELCQWIQKQNSSVVVVVEETLLIYISYNSQLYSG